MKEKPGGEKIRKWINVLTTGAIMGITLFGLFVVVLFMWNIFNLYNRLPIIRLIMFFLNPTIVFLIWARMYQVHLHKKCDTSFFFLKSFLVMILIYVCCAFAFCYIGGNETGRSLAVLFISYYSISMFIFIASIRILQIMISALNRKSLKKLYYLEFILPGLIFSAYKILQVEEFYNIRGEKLSSEYYSLPLIQVYLFGSLKLVIIFLIYCLALFMWRKLKGYFKKMNISELVYYRNGLITFLCSFLLFSIVVILFTLTLTI